MEYSSKHSIQNLLDTFDLKYPIRLTGGHVKRLQASFDLLLYRKLGIISSKYFFNTKFKKMEKKNYHNTPSNYNDIGDPK